MALWSSAILSCTVAASLAWAQPRAPQPPSPPVVLWNAAPQSGSYLGVGVVEVNDDVAKKLGMDRARGVEVASVADQSPAAKAGLLKGDVIVRFRGQDIEGVEQFARLVRETPVGREVEVEVFSATGEKSMTVSIGSRSRMPSRAQAEWPRFQAAPLAFDLPRTVMVIRNSLLGATLEPVDGQLAEFFGVEQGVLVRDVEPSSVAAKGGLQAGDVITAIEGETINRPNEVRRALGKSGGDAAAVAVVRNRSKVEIQVATGRPEAARRPLGTRSVSDPR